MPATIPDDSPSAPASSDDSPPQSKNFFVLVAYQVMLRVGWIFKTESIIMPAVVYSLSGAAWVRSCLPLLNRLGQSIPPLLMARQVKIRPRKKWMLFSTTCVMAAIFLILSLIWATLPLDNWLIPLIFLALYGIFFAGTGVNQLTFATLQGKLIATRRRGRLLLFANLFGATAAISMAAWLLPGWIDKQQPQFHLVFAFTGICFLVAAFIALTLSEPAIAHEEARTSVRAVFASAAMILKKDRRFRRLCLVAAMFGCSMMLFPHYSVLAVERLNLNMKSLVPWVVLQNAGTALFSFVVGPVADARGNRLVLRSILVLIFAAPLSALALVHYGGSWSTFLYGGVFILVGLSPVTIRILANYTLELAEPADHPKYLSTLSLCAAAPAMLSPLAGLVIDWIDFEPVFLGVSVIIAAAWVLSASLTEPRHDKPA